MKKKKILLALLLAGFSVCAGAVALTGCANRGSSNSGTNIEDPDTPLEDGSCKHDDRSQIYHRAAREATCSREGVKEHWECGKCEKLFADANLTEETTLAAVTIPEDASHHVHVTATEAKNPTCIEAGNEAYWYCVDCAKYFDDEALTHETTYADVYLQVDDEHGHKHDPNNLIAATSNKCQEGTAAHYECELCGELLDTEGHRVNAEDLVIAAQHNTYLVELVTCECNASSGGYYKCHDCGGTFADPAGTTPITVTEQGHLLKHVPVKAATCTEDGNSTEYWYCDGGKYFSDANGEHAITKEVVAGYKVDKIAHKNKKPHAANDPVCGGEAGNIAYWECPDCKKLFSDEACTHEITLAQTVVTKAHRLQRHAKEFPTCEAVGYEEYYECLDCGKLYSDADGKNEISAKVEIPVLGHDYPDGYTYDYNSMKYRKICANDEHHVEVQTAGTAEFPYLVNSAKSLAAALEKGGVIKLENSVQITDGTKLVINKDVNINLNGMYVVSNAKYVFEISGKAEVTIANGTIEDTVTADGKDQRVIKILDSADKENAPKVTLDGVAIEGHTGESFYGVYGVCIGKNATVELVNGSTISGVSYGVAVLQNATLTMNGGSISGSAVGVAANGGTNHGGSTIKLNNVDITVGSLGVYAPAINGVVKINGGTITADKEAALEVRAGTVTVSDAKLVSNAPFKGQPNGSGSTLEGVALGISQHVTEQPINVSVDHCTLEGVYALYEYDYQKEPTEGIRITLGEGNDFKGCVYSKNTEIAQKHDVEGAEWVYNAEAGVYEQHCTSCGHLAATHEQDGSEEFAWVVKNNSELQAALNKGGYITVIDEIDAGAYNVTVDSEKETVVDLGGHTITGSADQLIWVGDNNVPTVTIKNGTLTTTAEYRTEGDVVHTPAVIYSGVRSTIKLEEVNIQGEFIGVWTAGDLDIKGGTITTVGTRGVGLMVRPVEYIYDTAEYIISLKLDGTVINSGKKGMEIRTVKAEFTGVEINSNYSGVEIYRDTDLTMSNCKITDTMYYGIAGNGQTKTDNKNCGLDTKVVLNNCVISAGWGIYNPQWRGKLTVNGGTVTARNVGIEVRAGDVELNDVEIICLANEFEIKSNKNGTTVENGAALAVSQHTTNDKINVTVNGGMLQGVYAIYEQDVQDKAANDQIKINLVGNIALNGCVYSENTTIEHKHYTSFDNGEENWVYNYATHEHELTCRNCGTVTETKAVEGTEADPYLANDAESLKKALAEGGYVKLADSVELAEAIEITQDTTIDLNGKTVSVASGVSAFVMDTEGVTLKVIGGNQMARSAEKGKIVVADGSMGAIHITADNCTLVVENVDISDNTYTDSNSSRSDGALVKLTGWGHNVTLNNVNAETNNCVIYKRPINYTAGYEDDSKITVNGGKFTLSGDSTRAGFYLDTREETCPSNLNVEFNNVVVETEKRLPAEITAATAVYNNCTFGAPAGNTTSFLNTAIAASRNSHVTVNGGTYSATYAVYVYNSGATIEINGGTFNGDFKCDTASNSLFDSKIIVNNRYNEKFNWTGKYLENDSSASKDCELICNINSEAEWLKFAAEHDETTVTTEKSNTTYKVTKDLDFSKVTDRVDLYHFSGTIDFGGHTVKGLTQENTKYEYPGGVRGLFVLTHDATIKNLKYELSYFGTSNAMALPVLFAWRGDVTLDNVEVSGNATHASNSATAMVYFVWANAYNSKYVNPEAGNKDYQQLAPVAIKLTFNNCTNKANITNVGASATSGYSAAFLGQVTPNAAGNAVEFKNCVNEGTITGYHYSAMLIANQSGIKENGYLANFVVENCVNNGKIYAGAENGAALVVGPSNAEAKAYDAAYSGEGKVVNGENGVTANIAISTLTIGEDGNFVINEVEGATTYKMEFVFNVRDDVDGKPKHWGTRSVTIDVTPSATVKALEFIDAVDVTEEYEKNEFGLGVTSDNKYVLVNDTEYPGLKMTAQPTVYLTAYNAEGAVVGVSTCYLADALAAKQA